MKISCPRCNSAEFAIEAEPTNRPAVGVAEMPTIDNETRETTIMVAFEQDHIAYCRNCNTPIGKVDVPDPAHHWRPKTIGPCRSCKGTGEDGDSESGSYACASCKGTGTTS